MVCFMYIIVNTPHIRGGGDDDDDDDDNCCFIYKSIFIKQ